MYIGLALSTAGRTGLQVNSSERLPTYIYGKIAFLLSTTFFKYGSESSTGVKVKGHKSCLWSERSTGAKFPWNESSWTFRSPGANVPQNVSSSTGAKVLSMDFSLPGMKVQRNEKARYRQIY